MEQPNQGLSRFTMIITWISRVMAAVSAVSLGVMMAITVIDVGGRYLFNAPLEGAFELTGLLLLIAGTWGMGYCQLRKGNIRITVLKDLFSSRGQSLLDIVAYIVCIAAAGMITWQGSLRMYGYIFRELGGVTETLSLPFWPFMLMMAIGFGWACFIFLTDLYNSLFKVSRR